MKNFSKLGLVIVLLLQSCWWYSDDIDDTIEPFDYSQYEPVYLSREMLENSIALENPKPIYSSGKIYIKENLLFINEVREGFHVFDNSNPQNPIKIKFISVPGATDLAIRNNALYINQATDLIAAQLSPDLSTISVTKRVKETFPELISPDGYYPYDVPENSIVVNWNLKTD